MQKYKKKGENTIQKARIFSYVRFFSYFCSDFSEEWNN